MIVYQVDEAAAVADTVAYGAQLAFSSNRAVAILLGQKLIGAKRFEAGK